MTESEQTHHLKRQTFLLQAILATLERLLELAEREQAEYVEDAEPGTYLAGRRIG